MTEKKIREVIDKFAEEAKRIYGIKLCVVMDFPEPFAPLSKSLPP